MADNKKQKEVDVEAVATIITRLWNQFSEYNPRPIDVRLLLAFSLFLFFIFVCGSSGMLNLCRDVWYVNDTIQKSVVGARSCAIVPSSANDQIGKFIHNTARQNKTLAVPNCGFKRGPKRKFKLILPTLFATTRTRTRTYFGKRTAPMPATISLRC